MPLLGIFSKKSNPRSKLPGTAGNTRHSVSNTSLDDEEYVSIPSPNNQAPASASKSALPLRRQPEQAQVEQQPRLSYLDPLLEPPPRRSSLFQTFQDDPTAHHSTQSLPDCADHRVPRPQVRPQQIPRSDSASVTTTFTKKFMFGWGSSKERSKSAPANKQAPEDTSFNLKSFRHVRPDSPSSVVPPIPTPTPTSVMPSSSASFQVTSRRPRGNSASGHTISIPQTSTSQQTTPSQQKMAAGMFRQAARRSTTSLSLTDSPVLSPVLPSTRSSLDDRPPPSLLPPSQARSDTPTRLPRSQPLQGTTPPASRAPATTAPPRKSTNAFALSSSSSSSSEEDEDEDSGSADDGVGLSRKTTIKPRVAPRPPLKAAVDEQIQRAAPPSDLAPPRAQSSLGVYGPGARPRASLSVGALTPSAKEARASALVVANTRLMNSPRPSLTTASTSPVASKPQRALGSDTSESASDSDEDTPLSSLVPPRRPGTSLSSHSTPSTPPKPLVDLNSPSTLTGRPVRAPPPMAREEDTPRKRRGSADPTSRTGMQDSSQSSRISQAVLAQGSKVMRAQPPQGPSSSQVSFEQGSKASIVSRNQRAPQGLLQQSSRPPQGHALVTDTTITTSVPGRSTQLSTSVTPPLRPFARRESPASSTGDSSSGKAPLTPRDGSDLGGGSRSAYSGSATRSRHGHGRKPSVTFEDEQEHGGKGKSRERDSLSPQEARLRERRRSEARAAIELGNVVNGPPPVDEDDAEQYPNTQVGWGQAGMQTPMQPVPPMFNMGMNMQMPSVPGAFGFPPPPGMDAAYLVAHQQAMAIAKQTFQYAVAQQALAAANDEWERNSNASAQWGGSQWGGGSGYGGLGMGMGMRTSAVFPPAPRSMYAGSTGGVGGGAAWGWGGGGSVYGETFGPARNSIYSQGDPSVTVSGQQRTTRPRTKTAPSASAPPAGVGLGRMPVPPSSFRGLGH